MNDNHRVIEFASLEQELRCDSRAGNIRQITESILCQLCRRRRQHNVSLAVLNLPDVCKAKTTGNKLVDRFRLRLFGTTYNWKPGERRLLAEIATQCGVGDLVEEHPARVSYRRSLEILTEGDGAVGLVSMTLVIHLRNCTLTLILDCHYSQRSIGNLLPINAFKSVLNLETCCGLTTRVKSIVSRQAK